MNNVQKWADLLNGREYDNEVSDEEAHQANSEGIVIVFGASDDLMEFRGAVYAELDAYDGTTAYLDSSGLITNPCGNDCCPYHRKITDQATSIDAIFCGKDNLAWTFETQIEHKTFVIYEDGEPYCRGIVFELASVDKDAKNNHSRYPAIRL